MPKFGSVVREDHYIVAPTGNISEAAYPGNIGFEEMVKFYRVASDDDTDKMEELIKRGDWNGFRDLIKKVLKVSLK